MTKVESASRTTRIALIRGINVGRAKRIAMSELLDLVESLGYDSVRTVLNAGNVVFEAPSRKDCEIARSIEIAIVERFGFSAAVIVIAAGDLDTIIRESPFREVALDPARHLVAFVANPAALASAGPLLKENWTPDAIAIGGSAVYLWCPQGVSDSRLLKAFTRLTANSATTRNWATVLRLQAVASSGPNTASPPA